MTRNAENSNQEPMVNKIDFPLVDLHAHLEGELSMERAMQIAEERGVQLGVVEHGGRGQAIQSRPSACMPA